MELERDMVVHSPAHRMLVGTFFAHNYYHCVQVPMSVVQNSEVVCYLGVTLDHRFQLVYTEVHIREICYWECLLLESIVGKLKFQISRELI